IVSVSVSVGQQIQSGAEVCVLEAMKMETKILAEGGGEVKEVRVSPGDKVDTGQTLVVIA
ncbi:MAG: biotin/lipoyl-containing protein, partial [Nitrospinota bacterium]